MKIRNTAINRRISPVKAALAKEFRSNMTPSEKILWKHLRTNKLGGFHFRRQQVIQGFIADFYCHAAGIIIEIDGGIHKQQQKYDSERDKVLSYGGFKVIRFKDTDVYKKLPMVLNSILEACRERTKIVEKERGT